MRFLTVVVRTQIDSAGWSVRLDDRAFSHQEITLAYTPSQHPGRRRTCGVTEVLRSDALNWPAARGIAELNPNS